MKTLRSCRPITVLLLLAVTRIARGAYLESDRKESAPPPAPREKIRPPDRILPPPPPPPEGVPGPVADLLRRVEVGAPYTYRHVTIFPLLLRRPARQGVRTLDEALRNGSLAVREQESASVGELLVRNDGDPPVFLMAGEILAGGRQNRMIRDDVLLPPRSGFVRVAVYCSEKERWTGGGAFSSAQVMGHESLRRSAAKGEPQEDLWREMDSQRARVQAGSATRDYRSVYESDAVRRDFPDYRRRLDGFCRPETIGAVAVVGGQIRSADLFADPELFARLWEKLSAATWAGSAGGDWPDRWTGDATAVRRFLREAEFASYRERSTPGAGRLYAVAGAAEGSALVGDAAVIHLSLFPGAVVRPPEPIPMPGPMPRNERPGE